MLGLASRTDPQWARMALEDENALLRDHAHLERKAAGHMITLMGQLPYGGERLLGAAREELEHFELVIAAIEKRGETFHPLSPSPYGRRLHEAIRKPEPWHLLDSLLVCALIEARSCERMKLLADALPDPELSELYRGLLACEARHFHGYVDMAYRHFARDTVRARLHELADHEAAVLRDPPGELRLHST